MTQKTYLLLPAEAYADLLGRLQQDEAEQEAWFDAAEEAQMDWRRENPY